MTQDLMRPQARFAAASAIRSSRAHTRHAGVSERFSHPSTPSLVDVNPNARGTPATRLLVVGDDTANLEKGSEFQRISARLDRAAIRAVSRVYDFGNVDLLIDVGGGDGSQLASILQATPALHGVLFERPNVLPVARRQLAEAGVLSRSLLIGGDLRYGVPGGADAYLLRSVARDFDDDRAQLILEHVRTAMRPDGRLLLVESLLPGGGDTSAWIDVLIDPRSPLIHERKERTVEELRALLKKSDFALRRTVPTATPHSIVEAIPIQPMTRLPRPGESCPGRDPTSPRLKAATYPQARLPPHPRDD
jgi:hypothetical protein